MEIKLTNKNICSTYDKICKYFKYNTCYEYFFRDGKNIVPSENGKFILGSVDVNIIGNGIVVAMYERESSEEESKFLSFMISPNSKIQFKGTTIKFYLTSPSYPSTAYEYLTISERNNQKVLYDKVEGIRYIPNYSDIKNINYKENK